jgi:hypothetical protein
VPLPVAGGPGATVVAAAAVEVEVAVAAGVVAVAVGVAVDVGVLVAGVVAVAVVVVAVAVVVVAVAVVCCATITVPTMAVPWTVQWYGNVPAVLNVNSKVSPLVMFPESQTAVSDVVVCAMPGSMWVQVTESPTLMLTVPGTNARPCMLTDASAA